MACKETFSNSGAVLFFPKGKKYDPPLAYEDFWCKLKKNPIQTLMEAKYIIH